MHFKLFDKEEVDIKMISQWGDEVKELKMGHKTWDIR